MTRRTRTPLRHTDAGEGVGEPEHADLTGDGQRLYFPAKVASKSSVFEAER